MRTADFHSRKGSMVAVTKDHEGAVSELGKKSWIAMVRCGCVGGSKCASSFLDTNLVKAQSLDTPTSGYSCVYPVTLILLNVPLYVNCVIDSKTQRQIQKLILQLTTQLYGTQEVAADKSSFSLHLLSKHSMRDTILVASCNIAPILHYLKRP